MWELNLIYVVLILDRIVVNIRSFLCIRLMKFWFFEIIEFVIFV